MSKVRFLLILLFFPILVVFLIYGKFWGKKEAQKIQTKKELRKKWSEHLRNFSNKCWQWNIGKKKRKNRKKLNKNKAMNKNTKIQEKQDFKKYLQEIESPEYNGTDISRALPANANSLEKAKYKLCEKILAYQQDNNLPIEEVAKRIKLTTAETKNIFHYHLDCFFVPYKTKKNIVEHIAKSVLSKEYSKDCYPGLGMFVNGYDKGNCQHYVVRNVLGVNVSAAREFLSGTQFKLNKSLREEITDTERHFNTLTIENKNELDKVEKDINQYAARVVYTPPWAWNKLERLTPQPSCKLQ